MLKQHFSSSCDTVAVRALHFLRVPIFDEVSDQGPAIKTGDVAMFIATQKKKGKHNFNLLSWFLLIFP